MVNVVLETRNQSLKLCTFDGVDVVSSHSYSNPHFLPSDLPVHSFFPSIFIRRSSKTHQMSISSSLHFLLSSYSSSLHIPPLFIFLLSSYSISFRRFLSFSPGFVHFYSTSTIRELINWSIKFSMKCSRDSFLRQVILSHSLTSSLSLSLSVLPLPCASSLFCLFQFRFYPHHRQPLFPSFEDSQRVIRRSTSFSSRERTHAHLYC